MKFTEFVKFKAVMFHGTEVHVPEHIMFLSADKSGKVIGFESKPEADLGFEWWDNPTGDDMYDIGVVDLEGADWTSTLVVL